MAGANVAKTGVAVILTVSIVTEKRLFWLQAFTLKPSFAVVKNR